MFHFHGNLATQSLRSALGCAQTKVIDALTNHASTPLRVKIGVRLGLGYLNITLNHIPISMNTKRLKSSMWTTNYPQIYKLISFYYQANIIVVNAPILSEHFLFAVWRQDINIGCRYEVGRYEELMHLAKEAVLPTHSDLQDLADQFTAIFQWENC